MDFSIFLPKKRKYYGTQYTNTLIGSKEIMVLWVSIEKCDGVSILYLFKDRVLFWEQYVDKVPFLQNMLYKKINCNIIH